MYPKYRKTTTSKHTSDKGVECRSVFEAKVLDALDIQGRPYEYESHKFKYEVKKTRTYTPDLVLPNGAWVECKGWFTPKDRTKMKDIKASYPDQKIYLLFQKPGNYLSSRSNTTYAQWAEKHGFEWGHGPSIPKEWYE